MPYYTHIPFEPSNYDGFDTVNDLPFYVRALVDGGEDLVLYKNSAERNRVDKTEYLEHIGTISGVIRTSTSILELVLAIEYDGVPDFNYVYFGGFKRYYFVDNIISVNNRLWEIVLSVDTLMTYKDALLNLNAFVDRSETDPNHFLIDKKRVVLQGVDIDVYEVENEVFNKNDGDFDIDTDIRFVLNGYKLDSADSRPITGGA